MFLRYAGGVQVCCSGMQEVSSYVSQVCRRSLVMFHTYVQLQGMQLIAQPGQVCDSNAPIQVTLS